MKGQVSLDVFAFIAVCIVIFFMAPIALKIIHVSVGQFGNAIADSNITGSQVANQSTTAINDTATNFFDSFILIAFIANCLVLLIASFLVDIHPAFLVFYVVSVIIALIFAPTYFSGVQTLYDPTGALANETASLPMSGFVVNNFGAILLGVLILSGIIMFAKFKYGRNSG